MQILNINSTYQVNLNQLIELTEQFANYIKSQIKANKDIFVFFKGNLASGKTTFTSHLCKSLGIQAKITSPTFTGIYQYQLKIDERNINLHHLDIYQNSPSVDDFLEFYLNDEQNIFIVEWSENLDSSVFEFINKQKTSKIIEIEIFKESNDLIRKYKFTELK